MRELFRRVLLWTAYAAVLSGIVVAGIDLIPGSFAGDPTAAGTKPSASAGSKKSPAAAASTDEPAQQADDPQTATEPAAAESPTGTPSADSSPGADALRFKPDRPSVAAFTIATFNVLGHSHTARGGKAAGMAEGPTRIRRALGLLQGRGVSVAALQEFQRPQVNAFLAAAGSRWALYPGREVPGLGENSVAWRTDVFQVLAKTTKSYPYFNGRMRPMPYVKLRHRKTGVTFWVTSFHNPANTRKFHGQEVHRRRAVAMQSRDVNALRASSKLPVLVAGDMNDRAEYFCPMAAATGMRSADGSDHDGGCDLAGRPTIDWIMGTPGVSFSGYARHGAGGVSDHSMVTATARVPGKKGNGKGPLRD